MRPLEEKRTCADLAEGFQPQKVGGQVLSVPKTWPSADAPASHPVTSVLGAALGCQGAANPGLGFL